MALIFHHRFTLEMWGAVELGWTQAPSATLSIQFIIDSVHLEVYVLDEYFGRAQHHLPSRAMADFESNLTF